MFFSCNNFIYTSAIYSYSCAIHIRIYIFIIVEKCCVYLFNLILKWIFKFICLSSFFVCSVFPPFFNSLIRCSTPIFISYVFLQIKRKCSSNFNERKCECAFPSTMLCEYMEVELKHRCRLRGHKEIRLLIKWCARGCTVK